jgi:hypothetical protein
MIATMSFSERTDRGLPWGWRDWALLALLGSGTAFALRWYWNRAPNVWSDATMHIYRAFEVDRSIGEGILYPRLAMDFNFTYGAPLLQYRPPLVHYVIPALYWAGLDWIDAAKLTASIALLLAGIGMYVYARWLFNDRRSALVSGAAYLLAPYLLFDIQVRGAISEAAALAVLPWLFWAMHHTLINEGRLWPWLGALFTAFLVLAHNIIALFAVPVLLFYLCLLAWRGRAWRQVPAVLAALVTGLGMSAFYWIPALLESGYAQIEANMLDRPIETFLSPVSEWIQRQMAFDYWGLLQNRLSLWQAVLAVVAILALVITAIAAPRDSYGLGPASSKRPRFSMTLLAGITAVVMLLQLDVSLPFWDTVPLVRYIQFPSRLLGTAAFCIALLAGFLLRCEVPHPEVPRFLRGWRRPRLAGVSRWVAAVALLAIVLYAGAFQPPPRISPTDGLTEAAVSLEGLSERGRSYFTPFSNFLPISVKVDPAALPNPRSSPDASLAPMTYVPNLAVTGDQPFRLKLQVQSGQPFTLRLHRFFFPGWQVYAAGKPVPTGPTGEAGLVTADLPAGEYPVVAEFGPTPVRSLAGIISVISLLAWIAIGVSIRRARPILVAMAAVLLSVAVLAVVRFGTTSLLAAGGGGALRRPVAVAANFQDEINLLGYELPRQAWRAGDDLPLRLYWLAQRTPAADYKVFVHLVKPDDSAPVVQSDSFPVLGYSPTTRWEPGEIIPDDHQIHLDDNIPPGKYLLLIGMYHPETVQNLPVRGAAAQVLPGDRVVLTEIEVQSSSP